MALGCRLTGPSAANTETKPSAHSRVASWGIAILEIIDVLTVRFLSVLLRQSIPGKSASGLVLDHTGFKEVSFFFKVNHLAHPRKRILLVGEESFKPNLRGATIGNVAEVAFKHGGIESQHASGHLSLIHISEP